MNAIAIHRRTLPLTVKEVGRAVTGKKLAEGPRDALSQLKSCQQLYNCTKNPI